MRLAPLCVLLLVLAGCGSHAQSGGVSADAVAKASEAKKEMSAKLRTMTPAERVEYMKHHSSEMNTILQGSGLGSPAVHRTSSN